MAKQVLSKMAQAFSNALDNCISEGRNPGHIGAVILTNQAKGVGVIWRERLKVKKDKVKAETAEIKRDHDVNAMASQFRQRQGVAA